MKKLSVQQVTEVAISYRNKVKAVDRPKITSSRDAEQIFRAQWSEDMELLEEFNVLFLTRSNEVKGFFHVSRGGVSATVVDPKIIFAAALKSLAAAIILAHNHPSGGIKPSEADIMLTRKLRQGGEFLDIPVLDHLILSAHSGYYSFADDGTL